MINVTSVDAYLYYLFIRSFSLYPDFAVAGFFLMFISEINVRGYLSNTSCRPPLSFLLFQL